MNPYVKKLHLTILSILFFSCTIELVSFQFYHQLWNTVQYAHVHDIITSFVNKHSYSDLKPLYCKNDSIEIEITLISFIVDLFYFRLKKWSFDFWAWKKIKSNISPTFSSKIGIKLHLYLQCELFLKILMMMVNRNVTTKITRPDILFEFQERNKKW